MTTPSESPTRGADLVVVANRLPVRGVEQDGERVWATSPGGVVSALVPALRDADGLWIGWAGNAGDGQSPPREHEGIALRAVPITEDEYDDFYLGFSNATLWPLYHDAIRPPIFDRVVVAGVRDGQRTLRRRRGRGGRRRARRSGCTTTTCSSCRRCCASCGPTCGSGSSCTSRSRRGSCSCSCRGGARSSRACSAPTSSASRSPGGGDELRPSGPAASPARRGRRRHDRRSTAGGVRVGAFPISIDTADLSSTRQRSRRSQARARRSARELGDPEIVLLGVDRLDYTKGIDRRIRAVGELFAEGALDPARHVVVQIAVPSRERGRALPAASASSSSGSSARSTASTRRVGQPPIHYLHQSRPRRRAGRALPRRRRHARHPAARRHEPRRQGVRRVPRRRRRACWC